MVCTADVQGYEKLCDGWTDRPINPKGTERQKFNKARCNIWWLADEECTFMDSAERKLLVEKLQHISLPMRWKYWVPGWKK